GYNITCSQIDIGNAATPLTERMVQGQGVMQADGRMAIESRMNVDDVGRAVVYIVNLPLDTNVLFLTVMANLMPFVGRGGKHRALIDPRHVNLRPCSHLRQSFYVAEGAGEDVARAREPRFVATANRSAAEAEGDGVTIGPIGDLAGCHYGARIFFPRGPNRNLEIDLFAPGQRR